MIWKRVAPNQWVLLCVDRAVVASIRRHGQDNYSLVSLANPGGISFFGQLAAAKRAGSSLWRKTERKYRAALYFQSSEVPRS